MKKRYFAWLLMLILMMVMGMAGCSKNKPKIVVGGTGTGFSSSGDAEEEITLPDPDLFIYKGINESTGILAFIKAEGALREFSYYYTGGTMIYDRYGALTSIEELTPGRVYELVVLSDSQEILTMTESSQAWVYEGLHTYSLDLDRNILTVGDSNYELREETPVFDGSLQYTRNQISTEDELTIIGKGSRILSVQVTTGHGTIVITNVGDYKGGYFVLGNVAAGKIEKNMKMEVREGTFALKAAVGSRAGVMEVKVVAGKKTKIDLRKVETFKNKICLVSFELVQEGTKVTIGGKEIDTSAPYSLPYGVYTVTASLDGYDTWTRTLIVSSKTANIRVDLGDVTSSDTSETTTGTGTNTSDTSSDEHSPDSHSNEHTDTNNSTTDNTDNTSTNENTGGDATDDINNQSNTLVNEIVDILTGNDD